MVYVWSRNIFKYLFKEAKSEISACLSGFNSYPIIANSASLSYAKDKKSHDNFVVIDIAERTLRSIVGIKNSALSRKSWTGRRRVKESLLY